MELPVVLAKEMSTIAKGLLRKVNNVGTRRVQPYFAPGHSNFTRRRYENEFYVDKTRFIPVLESLGDILFFFRPPRWGKSLFQTTLEAYYDLAVPKSNFDSLFSSLDIYQNPTLGSSQYFVLKLVRFSGGTFLTELQDFSVHVEVSDSKGIRPALNNKINCAVTAFAYKYGFLLAGDADEFEKAASVKGQDPKKTHPIDIVRNNAVASFQSLVNAVRATATPLYLVIDEYDRFANKLLIENLDLYGSPAIGECGERGLSVLQSIFEAVKEASDKFAPGMFRCFVVGLVPLPLNDASGANLFADVTHRPELGELLGFTREDLGVGLDLIIQVYFLIRNRFVSYSFRRIRN